MLEDFDRDQADGGAAFKSDYRSLREVALAHLSGRHLEAKAVIDRAHSGDYAEWPTWLPLAIDLITQLRNDDVLREVAAALRREDVPKTSPMVAAQASGSKPPGCPRWPHRPGTVRVVHCHRSRQPGRHGLRRGRATAGAF